MFVVVEMEHSSWARGALLVIECEPRVYKIVSLRGVDIVEKLAGAIVRFVDRNIGLSKLVNIACKKGGTEWVEISP